MDIPYQKKQEADKLMRETDGINALYTLLSLMLLPAFALIIFGARSWYFGQEQSNEDKLRLGRMFTMFGVIFMIIILICSYFLKGSLPGL